jgi:hypothetical protein
LTVCLVVLGKHIETLQFIEVLLGDEPALEPEERFYQRLLAGDGTEAADMAEDGLRQQALGAYYDSVAIKALALAHTDAAQGKLSQEKQLKIRDTIEEVVEDLRDHHEQTDKPAAGGEAAPRAAQTASVAVLCVASRSPLDEAACVLLAQLLERHGLPARVQPAADVISAKSFKIDARDAPLVCLSYFGVVGSPAHVRYLIRRLRRVMPNARFLAGFWMLAGQQEKAEEWRAAVGAHLVATSLAQALAICVAEAQTRGVRVLEGSRSAAAAETLASPALA